MKKINSVLNEFHIISKKKYTDEIRKRYTSLYEQYLKCSYEAPFTRSYMESVEHANKVLSTNNDYSLYVNSLETYSVRSTNELYFTYLGYDKSKSLYHKDNRNVMNSDEAKLAKHFTSERNAKAAITRLVNKKYAAWIEKVDKLLINSLGQAKVSNIELVDLSEEFITIGVVLNNSGACVLSLDVK